MSGNCPLCRNERTRLLSRSSRRGETREYHQCDVCRLIFVPAQFHLSPEEEKRRYDLHENDPRDERYVRFLSKLTRPLAERLGAGQLGLDFGCGSGPTIAALLEEKGHEVLNYDPFYFPHGELLSRTYDFISCSEVIEHFRSPREEFQKLNSLCREGGTVGVMTEIWREAHGESIDRWWYSSEPTHICFYTAATFDWLARWLSWKIIYREGNVMIFRKN